MRRQFGGLAGARLVAAALQAVTLIFLARSIPVGDFGIISAILAAQTTLLGVASLGVIPYILREHARGNYGHVRSAARLNLVSSLVAGSIAALVPVVLIDNRELMMAGIILALVVSFDKNIEARLGIAIARGSAWIPAVSIIGRSAVGSSLFLLLSLLGMPPVLAFGTARLVGSIAGVFHLLWTTQMPKGTQTITQSKLLADLWPLAVSNSLGALRSLDALVVAVVGGPVVAGLYSAASKTLAPVAVVAGAVSSVLMPRSSLASSGDAQGMVKTIFRWSLIGTVGIAPLSLASEWIMTVLFGPDYSGSAGAFAWILTSLPFAASTPMIATILQAQRKDRYVAANTALFTPLTLSAVGAGALFFGATGAGAAFAITTWARGVRLAWRARDLL